MAPYVMKINRTPVPASFADLLYSCFCLISAVSQETDRSRS